MGFLKSAPIFGDLKIRYFDALVNFFFLSHTINVTI